MVRQGFRLRSLREEAGATNRIKVQCIVRVYAVDGRDCSPKYDDPQPTVIVHSDPILGNRVGIAIDLGDGTVGHLVTVVATDLETALRNARSAS